MISRIREALVASAEYHQNRYLRGIDQRVSPGCRWLDLGAGTRLHDGWIGPTQNELAGRAGLLVGCDLMPEHMAENPFLSAAVAADGKHLPFADGAFDLVTANMVLEHLLEPAAVLSEVARVLAPGGRFIMVTPNKRHPVIWLLSTAVPGAYRRLIAQRTESLERHVFITHYRANTTGAVRALARRCGLTVRELEPFASFPMLTGANPMALAEGLWVRLGAWWPIKAFGSNLYACLEKPG